MASLKLAYGTETSFTVTNLHSKVSSTTAGWTSGAVDNTTDLYLDAMVQVTIAAVNTAPANDQMFYLFAYGYSNSSDQCTTGATTGNSVGTEGNLTFPAITGRQQLPYKAIPYIGQNVALKSQEFSICDILGLPFGSLPPYWGVAILNYSGMTLAASGNAVKWRGVYLTSA